MTEHDEDQELRIRPDGVVTDVPISPEFAELNVAKYAAIEEAARNNPPDPHREAPAPGHHKSENGAALGAPAAFRREGKHQ